MNNGLFWVDDIMSAPNKTLAEKILSFYKEDGTYLEKHSGDIAVAAGTIVAFSLLTTFFTVKSYLKSLKPRFNQIRCDPSYAPFAGEIAAPEGVSKLQFTADNFEQCTKGVLKGVAEKAFSPFDVMTTMLNSSFSNMTSATSSMMAFFDELRSNIASIPAYLYSIIMNVLIPLQALIRAIEDIFSRIAGVVSASFQLAMGTNLLLQSILNIIVEFCIGVLVAMAAVILGFLASFFFSWMALPVIATMTVLVALLLPILLLLFEVFGAYTDGGKVPKVPNCFHPEAVILDANGKGICISDVRLGQKLYGGGHVVAKMVLENNAQLYEFMASKVVVSGTHLVFDSKTNGFITVEEAFNNGWFVRKHQGERPSTLTCLITSNHIIHAGEAIFHDWEDNNGSPSKNFS